MNQKMPMTRNPDYVCHIDQTGRVIATSRPGFPILADYLNYSFERARHHLRVVYSIRVYMKAKA